MRSLNFLCAYQRFNLERFIRAKVKDKKGSKKNRRKTKKEWEKNEEKMFNKIDGKCRHNICNLNFNIKSERDCFYLKEREFVCEREIKAE